MNTLTTIAGWLAGSAVLQMVVFYCYSTYQKSRLLKSLSYEGYNEEKVTSPNKPGGKIFLAGTTDGGKMTAIHTSAPRAIQPFNLPKSKSENSLLQQVVR